MSKYDLLITGGRVLDPANDLDEVFLTKQLSGDLNKDVSSSTAKADINFYDVGIPGYKGKPLTQNENRLNEAGGNEKMFAIGLGAAVNFNKFLNTITGRTKMLKERVRLDELKVGDKLPLIYESSSQQNMSNKL